MLWAAFRDMLHYCAYQLAEIADNARDLDLAVRWGFGWNQGPFEIWQTAGWQRVAGWISEDISAGKAMAQVPLPAWATDKARTGVHTPQGSYSASADTLRPRSSLPVYRRQPYPDRLVGEPVEYGQTVFETDAVRMWTTGDDIGIVSFKSKMHAIGEDVLDGVMQAIETAERNVQGRDHLADRAAVLGRREPVGFFGQARERCQALRVRLDDENSSGAKRSPWC